MRYAWAFALAAVLALGAAPAMAQPVEDNYFITIDWDETLVAGGGSGYGGGQWYYYENTGWWNQWFYNAPYDPDRWKIIDLGFDIQVLDPALDSYFEIVVNWSTGMWSDLGNDYPPIPPLSPTEEEDYIVRSDPPFIQLYDTLTEDPEHWDFHYEIPDFNPEWVSIDVYGWNFELTNGYIWHECVPEPTTVSLFALAGLALLRRR